MRDTLITNRQLCRLIANLETVILIRHYYCRLQTETRDIWVWLKKLIVCSIEGSVAASSHCTTDLLESADAAVLGVLL